MVASYLLMVRSFANPNSLSTQRSRSSLFLDREEVLGAIFWASATVTMLSNSSNGDASAVHSNLALFSYITYNHSVNVILLQHLETKHLLKK